MSSGVRSPFLVFLLSHSFGDHTNGRVIPPIGQLSNSSRPLTVCAAIEHFGTFSLSALPQNRPIRACPPNLRTGEGKIQRL